MVSTKNYEAAQLLIIRSSFLSIILKWFLKDHVTLKTGITILIIQICY